MGRLSGPWPCVCELGHQAHEFVALRRGECLECNAHVFALTTAESVHRLHPSVGDAHKCAPRIGGVGLADRESALDCLLHQARGAGLVDANLLGEGADGERLQGVRERAEESELSGAAKALTHSGAGRAGPRAGGVAASLATVLAKAAAPPGAGPTHAAAAVAAATFGVRATPPAQPRKRGNNRVGLGCDRV